MVRLHFLSLILLPVLLTLFMFGCGHEPVEPDVHPATMEQTATDAYKTIYEGRQPGGALFKIWLPDDWNGELVTFAHGYVAPGEPVAIPEDQLVLADGTDIPSLVNEMGFAFAVTSYRENGLTLENAMLDLVELTKIFEDQFGAPAKNYLIGASEGGLITIKSAERFESLFSGGLALCGPVGDFRGQLDYFLDFRVVFDYFFPGILPGSPVRIPQELMKQWEKIYAPRVLVAIREDTERTLELLRVTKAVVDPQNPETAAETVLGLLWYNVFATNDAISKLGGVPYDNTQTIYHGSSDDRALNEAVERISADPKALRLIESVYQTRGTPLIPVVTGHTIGDPIVPAWHERQYKRKLMENGFASLHSNLMFRRYGHCSFEVDEVLKAFNLLILKVTGQEQISLTAGKPIRR